MYAAAFEIILGALAPCLPENPVERLPIYEALKTTAGALRMNASNPTESHTLCEQSNKLEALIGALRQVDTLQLELFGPASADGVKHLEGM